MASDPALVNISLTLQAIAQGLVQAVTELQQLMPQLTSGQLQANTLVIGGFVRVTGVSVVVLGGAPGGLYDAASIADATADNQIYVMPALLNYVETQLIFKNGLVYKPGAGERAAVFYVRS